MGRIIGQCSLTDFRYLEHLSGIIARGEEVDLTNLTNNQKMAVKVLHHFNECGIPFKILLKIREVLIWGMDNKETAFEYKILQKGDRETLGILRSMRPLKGKEVK